MDFKKLSEVAKIEEVSDESCVLVEENGVIKRAPKTAVGGNGKYDMVIEYCDLDYIDGPYYVKVVSGSYDVLREKLQNGERPNIRINFTECYYEIAYTFNIIGECCLWDDRYDSKLLCIMITACDPLYYGWNYNWLLYPDGSIGEW